MANGIPIGATIPRPRPVLCTLQSGYALEPSLRRLPAAKAGASLLGGVLQGDFRKMQGRADSASDLSTHCAVHYFHADAGVGVVLDCLNDVLAKLSCTALAW